MEKPVRPQPTPHSLPGFGTFSTVKRKARTGRNPRTGRRSRSRPDVRLSFPPEKVSRKVSGRFFGRSLASGFRFLPLPFLSEDFRIGDLIDNPGRDLRTQSRLKKLPIVHFVLYPSLDCGPGLVRIRITVKLHCKETEQCPMDGYGRAFPVFPDVNSPMIFQIAARMSAQFSPPVSGESGLVGLCVKFYANEPTSQG